MYFPSRRERRAFAKKLGLRKKDETYDQWLERTRRSQEAGKQIHLQRLQDSYNSQISQTPLTPSDLEITQPSVDNQTITESNISE